MTAESPLQLLSLDPGALHGMPLTHHLLCAGARVVVAQTYARIFFRNCVST